MNEERPIEKLLRRAAQKRAAGLVAPPQLHPANRRLLQAEVAQQFPRGAANPPAAASTPLDFWAGLRARWYYALAVIPVIGILAFVLVPALFKKEPYQLALHTENAVPTTAPALAAPAPVAQMAPAEISADSLAPAKLALTATNSRPAEARQTRFAITSPAPQPLTFSRAMAPAGGAVADAARPETAATSLMERETAARPVLALGAVAPGLRPDGTLADRTARAGGGAEETQRLTLNSQGFTNIGAPPRWQNRSGPADRIPPPVLAKFKIQQQGRDMRVIDEDGSVYRGVVDEANTVYSQVVAQKNEQLSAATGKGAKLLTPAAAARPAPQFYFYRVAGTNRTLNQNVVFTWNFLPTNEAVAATQLKARDVLSAPDPAALPAQFPALLQNSFINGRAQFGEGREVEVNAVPVQR